MLKIKNSLGNKIEEFIPLKDKNVELYTCGPTVYNYAHIGNFRAYVWEDILRRYLLFSEYKVKQVMNLTDVDDKTIKESKEKRIPLNEYTKKYKDAFFEDLKTLNIMPVEYYPSATEHIGEMVEIIKKLLKKGLAYKAENGDIYYSIKKFPGYGKLAGIDTTKLKAGARISQDEYEKEGIGDFALWKAYTPEDGEVYWETELGKGRPGWHIECSAMSTKYLGETFDLHTGGVDNKFPHHENEIAQSEGATGKPFVKYWMHCAHLQVDGEKMSKSKGNFYTIRDLLYKGLKPKAIRYVLANSQYNQPLNFTIESVKNAEKTLDGIQRFIERTLELEGKDTSNIDSLIEEALTGFKKSMDSDLNVPEGMKYVFEFITKTNKLIDEEKIGSQGREKILNFLKQIDSVIGVMKFEKKEIELNKEEKQLLEERKKAREEKNWNKADEIRDKFKEKGFVLVDNKDGTTSVKKE